MKKTIASGTCVFLLFGFIWGLCEAIIGTFLHLLPHGIIPGLIMYTIGFYCMLRCYSRTGSISSIFYCGAIAAGLKLLSFFFTSPGMYITVYKPAFCILLETAISALIIVFCFRGTHVPHSKKITVEPGS